MQRRKPFLVRAFSLILFASLVSCNKSPQAAQDPNSAGDTPGLFSKVFNSTPPPVTVPEGTDLTVVLDQTISTAQNRSGESFRATVAAPVVIEGKTVIPRDASVTGHIVESVPSGRLKGVAKLDLTLDSVEIAGKSYDIATADEGRVGKNHNKRNGILIGAAAGAGAGTAGAAYTGKKDIRVPGGYDADISVDAPRDNSGKELIWFHPQIRARIC